MKDVSTQQFPTSPVIRLAGRSAWLEPAEPAMAGSVAGFVQGSLALDFPLPGGLAAAPRSLPLAGDGQATTAEAWARRFLQAVVEVVSCDRPLSQLVRWTDRAVYLEIARRQRLSAARRADGGRGSRHHVATVHVHQSAAHVAEVAARVSYRGRSRALAARLDLKQGRWLCTAICFG